MTNPHPADRLGLERDPFRDIEGELLPRLASVCDELLYAVEFVSPLVVARAEEGAGKSTLALAVVDRFGARRDLLFHAAARQEPASLLLHKLADYLALPIPEVQSDENFPQALVQALAREAFEPVLLVVDDAQFLDPSTLRCLVQLAQLKTPATIRVLLFADAQEPLPTLSVGELEPLAFDIADITLAEAATLLNTRFRAAGFNGDYFTRADVEPWWQRADGSIHKLLAGAEKSFLASEKEASTAPGRANRTAKIPTVHIIAIAGLVAMLGVVYLYSGEDAVEQRQLAPSLELEAPASSQAPPESPARSSRTSSAASSQASVKSSASQAPQSSRASSLSQASRAALQQSSDFSRSAIRPDPGPHSRDERQILSWASDGYAIQVLGVSKQRSIDNFLREQANRDRLRVYKTRRRGEAWFVAVEGYFPTRESARQAISELPSLQRDAGPWIRPVAELQREIRGQ